MRGILDTHIHVWRLLRGDYSWMSPDLGAIYRDFDIDDIWSTAQASGVSQVLLVQAAATAGETDYLLSLAAETSRVAGVVGWVDFEAANSVVEIERRASNPMVSGLRPMIADIPDKDWIKKPEYAAALEAMAGHNLVLDGHARADLVPVMAEIADRHPTLKIVLNHAGKPQISSGNLSQWRTDLSALAQRPNVFCKLSGLLTEAGTRIDDEAIGEIVEHIASCFGADRVMWGSDWPVLNLASNYEMWIEQSERLIDRFFAGQQQGVWSENAQRIYLNRSGA